MSLVCTCIYVYVCELVSVCCNIVKIYSTQTVTEYECEASERRNMITAACFSFPCNRVDSNKRNGDARNEREEKSKRQ